MKTRSLFYFSLILISGCVTYTAVGPGELAYAGLKVQTGQAWNQVPEQKTKPEFLRPLQKRPSLSHSQHAMECLM